MKTVSLDITNDPIEVSGSHENDNTLLPSQMVTTWLREQKTHFEVNKKDPNSTNLNKCNKPQDPLVSSDLVAVDHPKIKQNKSG